MLLTRSQSLILHASTRPQFLGVFFPVFFYVMPLEKQVGYQSNIFLYDGNKNQTDLIAKKAITPKRLDCLGRSQTFKK